MHSAAVRRAVVRRARVHWAVGYGAVVAIPDIATVDDVSTAHDIATVLDIATINNVARVSDIVAVKAVDAASVVVSMPWPRNWLKLIMCCGPISVILPLPTVGSTLPMLPTTV